MGQPAYAASKGGVVGPDAAGGARTGPRRHPRGDDCARAVSHADGGRVAAGECRPASGAGIPYPAPARPAAGIRRAGRAYRDAIQFLNGEVIRFGRRLADAAAIMQEAEL